MSGSDPVKFYLTHSSQWKNASKNNADIEFPEKVLSAPFALNDLKSCNACRQVNCNREVLLVDMKGEVHLLNFEDYCLKVGFSKHKCDYLIYDGHDVHNFVAFCELTCSSARYVSAAAARPYPGKRVMAEVQLKSSIEYVLSAFDPLLKSDILSRPFRYAVFAWRNPEINYTDYAVSNMQSFSRTPSSEEELLISDIKVIEHNFRFIQIKYPAHFSL